MSNYVVAIITTRRFMVDGPRLQPDAPLERVVKDVQYLNATSIKDARELSEAISCVSTHERHCEVCVCIYDPKQKRVYLPVDQVLDIAGGIEEDTYRHPTKPKAVS